ncbi:urease accessory protein UreF [Rhodobacteraceae bacterium]|nr:urease accessory protein UreF [Paracoccaceae bacterium]
MATDVPIRTSMGIRRIMTIDAKLLTLIQWLSPAYPIGAFSWSHGLEAAVADRWITDADELGDWLTALLTDGSIRTDAILIASAYDAQMIDEITNLNQIARAYAASNERLREAERQGAAFAKITREVWGLDLPELQLPIALGRAGRLVQIERQALIATYAHGFCSNLVAAAQRLMKLGQSDGQAIIARLNADCLILAKDIENATPHDIHSQTFLSDIASMRHETTPQRLFQS